MIPSHEGFNTSEQYTVVKFGEGRKYKAGKGGHYEMGGRKGEAEKHLHHRGLFRQVNWSAS